MQRKTTRVLCVDDHAFLAEGLKTRLNAETDMECVGRLSTADGLTSTVRETGANVVLLDIEMPGQDAFEALRDLARQFPEVRVIMLSAYVRDSYIDAAYKAGAWGYLSKADDPDEIVDAIRRVSHGKFTFGPEVVNRCQPAQTTHRARLDQGRSRLSSLTPREHEILRMIARGLTRKDIAKTICRSPKTVDNHRAAIMEKLGIHDQVGLTRFAIGEGLVEV